VVLINIYPYNLLEEKFLFAISIEFSFVCKGDTGLAAYLYALQTMLTLDKNIIIDKSSTRPQGCIDELPTCY